MTKPYLQPVSRGRVRLRLLEAADLPLTLAWRNQARVRTWFINSDEITAEQHQLWFRKYLERDDDFVFIIEETSDLQKPIGQLALYHVDRNARRAEFGRLMIGEPDALRRGLAAEATAFAIDLVFQTLQLSEAECFIKTDNVGSLKVMMAAGFNEVSEEDGLKRLVVRPADRPI